MFVSLLGIPITFAALFRMRRAFALQGCIVITQAPNVALFPLSTSE